MDQVICDALRQALDCQIALSPGFRWGTTMLAGQPITMDDVLAETAITYPETYVQDMTGGQIKAILEDIADNLFNPDPYYQQGGDMVRVGGMDYTCAPEEAAGKRISGMTARRWQRDRGRQELSRRRLGFGQSAGRQTRQRRRRGLFAPPENSKDQAPQQRHAQRHRQQSRHHRRRIDNDSIIRSVSLAIRRRASCMQRRIRPKRQAAPCRHPGRPERPRSDESRAQQRQERDGSTTAARTRTSTSRWSLTAPACTCCAMILRR